MNQTAASKSDHRDQHSTEQPRADLSVEREIARSEAVTSARKFRPAATRKQIEANRENALRSTGPLTPEGKAVAARNALKHGLTSKDVLLPGDNPVEFKVFVAGLRIYWSPVGEQEEMLVKHISNLGWRNLRIDRIESGVLSYALSGQNEIEAASKVVEIVCRYATTQDRRLSQAMRDLRQLQDRRRKQSNDPQVLREQLARHETESSAMEKLLDSGTRRPEAEAMKPGEPRGPMLDENKARETKPIERMSRRSRDLAAHR